MDRKQPLPENPFFTGTDIPDAYFCDREQETEKMISHIRNGSHIVLKSPRRIGKSSLIKHVFRQKEISGRMNTLFVDIYGTKTAADFQTEFQNSLLRAPFAKGTRLKIEFESLLKGAYLDLGSLNTVTGQYQLPKVGFAPSMMPRIPLPELFAFLENTDNPNLVVFDEFQQIEEYPERMAAILRSFVQQATRTCFVFSGSSRHLLTTMFQSSNQPFYKSAVPMDLDILSLGAYVDFCRSMFGLGGRAVDGDAVAFVYHLFSGETYLLQETMKETYTRTFPGGLADKETVLAAIGEMLSRKDTDYREIMNRLGNKKERNTLFCIASEGIASGMTSSSMLKKYDLDNASSVQNALVNLGEGKLNLIDRIAKGTYVIQDRLFELWIAWKSGYLPGKYQYARERFDRQREIVQRIPGMNNSAH